MKKEHYCRLCFIVSVVFLIASSPFSENIPDTNKIFKAVVPSQGTNTLILPVSKWGRYSLRTEGNNPVALSIADRRNGIFLRDGDPGQKNARIDLFLDIGEYRLRTQGVKTVEGSTTVSALPFTFPSDFKPSYLIPLRENRLTLNDMQQAVFWFDINSDTTIYIEAAGRNLEDMRLWRNGDWMVETSSNNFIFRSKPEKPLKVISMVAHLQKGTYMVGLYGGKGTAWAEESPDHPLYVQYGIENLASNISSSLTVPLKGYIEFLLSSATRAVIVEEKEKKFLKVEVLQVDSSSASMRSTAVDSIFEKSSSPRLALVLDTSASRMVRISGIPGQTFTIKTLGNYVSQIYNQSPAEYWVSSLNTGNYQDQIGASGVCIKSDDNSIAAVDVDTLSPECEYAHRFNLLSNINTFIWVQTDGKYTVRPGGDGVLWRIYRYFVNPPANFKYPEYQEQAGNVDLSRGLYFLELTPKKKGIAAIVIAKASMIGNIISAGKQMLGAEENRKWNYPRPSVQFPNLKLDGNKNYQIIINDQSPEISSVSIRKLPINPDTSLTVWCKQNEKIRVPVRLKGERLVSVVDISNQTVPFSIDEKVFTKAEKFGAGDYTLTIQSDGPAAKMLCLKAVSPERLYTTPVPSFPDDRIAVLPDYPNLSSGTAAYLNLDRHSSQPYIIDIKEPSFYKIETTGRLATQLRIRDRFSIYSQNEQQNGVGRNAMLIVYLLTGRYQIDVITQEETAGRLGVLVSANPMLDGGVLEKDIDNRTMPPSFTGVSYNIKIHEKGTYKIESFGQTGNFPIRLEDKDGWPFEPAQNSGPYTLVLDNGSYRLISLPAEQNSRRIARMTSVNDTKKLTGKGPHILELNTKVSSTWVEDKKKEIESPVVFTFKIPAPISATMCISNGFTASLFRDGSDSANLKWSGKRKYDIDTGNYRLEIRPVRKGNFAPYEVSITTNDLIAGLSYHITKPKTLRVSVGNSSVIEFFSQGSLDVSAQLLDEKAINVIEANDDSYMDWNFSISRLLKPGRYFLKIQSAETEFTSTDIFMRSLADTLLDSIKTTDREPLSLRCNLNRHIGIIPVKDSDSGDIVTCAVQGKARMGCSFERKNGNDWVPVAQNQGLSPSLTIARERGSKYRIRVWSDYSTNENITLTCFSIVPELKTWKEITDGFSVQTRQIGERNCAWFKADLGDKAPGHFRTAADQKSINGISVSTALDSVFTDEGLSWFSSNSQYTWVEMRYENPGRYKVKFDPVFLEENNPLSIRFTGSRPGAFNTKLSKNVIGILTAVSDGNHPFCGILQQTNDYVKSFDLQGIHADQSMWFDNGISAAVSLPTDNRKLVIWNGQPATDGSETGAQISWIELPVVDNGDLKSGISVWNTTKPSASQYRFPKESKKRLRITIPQGCAVLLIRDDGSRVLDCAFTGKSIVKEYVTEGGELYLLGLKSESKFDITEYEIGSGDIIVTDRQFEKNNRVEIKTVREGSLVFPVSSNVKKGNIYYRGAVQSVSTVKRNGMLYENLKDGASIESGSLMSVNHGAGWIRINICDGSSKESIMACKWGFSTDSREETEISKSSVQKLADKVNWYTFVIRDTQHVNMSVPMPLAAILIKDSKPVNYQEAEEKFNWDLPLTSGKYSLGIHAINGANLQGAELSILFRPVISLSEKNPFSGYITPGESRLLSFEVQKKSAFGIGLKLKRETVEARLFDSDGKVLGAGKQQFLTLERGVYYIWLRVPESAEGTECTAYLFGQEPPPNEPPEKLVKWFISGAEGPRPLTDNSSGDEQDRTESQPSWMRFLHNEDQQETSESQYENGSEEGQQESIEESDQNSESNENSESDENSEQAPDDSESGQEGE
jgi:hypothetical protein